MGWFSSSCSICNGNVDSNNNYKSFPITKSIVYKQNEIQASDGQKLQLNNGEIINPMFMARFGDYYCYWGNMDQLSKVDICSRSCAKKYAANKRCGVIIPIDVYPGFDIITHDSEKQDKYTYDNNIQRQGVKRGSS